MPGCSNFLPARIANARSKPWSRLWPSPIRKRTHDVARPPSRRQRPPEFLLADLFPLDEHDPMTAAQQAAQLPTGPGRDTALQVVASTWANDDPEGAFNWASTCPPDQITTTPSRRSCPRGQTKIHSGRRACSPLCPRQHPRSRHRQHRPTMGTERSRRRAGLEPAIAAGRRTTAGRAKRSLKLGAIRSHRSCRLREYRCPPESSRMRRPNRSRVSWRAPISRPP